MDNDLYLQFSQMGYEMIVFSPRPTRGISEVEHKFYKKKEMLYDGRMIVHRFLLFGEKKNTIQRAIRYLISISIQFVKSLSIREIDLVFLESTPPIIGIVGALLHKIKRIPFIYVVQDIFPDSLVNTGLSRKGSLAWKIGRIVEKFTYRNATKIIVISESFKQNLIRKHVPNQKIEVIPNWINTDQVYPICKQNNALFSRLSLNPSLFYVTYCGNIGHTQNFELLIQIAKRLVYISDLRIVLFGDGAYLSELLETIKQENITNIIHYPFQPYEDIASVFSLGDVGLIISKPGVATNSVPSKTWSIMAAARPVLASFDLDSVLREVIEESQCGIIVPADDADKLYNAILKLYRTRFELESMGQRGRDYIVNKLNKEVCTSRYVEVLNSVLQSQ